MIERSIALDMQVNTKYTLYIEKHCETLVIPLWHFPCTEEIIKDSFGANDLQLATLRTSSMQPVF